MKALVIPDVHLRTWMFRAAERSAEEICPDIFVVLGDLVDSHDIPATSEAYKDTLDEAIRFATDHPDSLWCWGNHDLSYICDAEQSEYSSELAPLIKEKLLKIEAQLLPGHLQYIHRIDNCLFLHGGLCVYCDEILDLDKNSKTDIDELVANINAAAPLVVAVDDTSPVWFRAIDHLGLIYIPDGILQIVGHTPVRRITEERCVLTCDTFASYTNGKPYGDKTFLLIDTETQEWQAVPAHIQEEHHADT